MTAPRPAVRPAPRPLPDPDFAATPQPEPFGPVGQGGAHDALVKREPTEPYFALIARDPIAASLVEVWALLRAGKGLHAHEAIQRVLADATNGAAPHLDPHDDQIESALNVASAMRKWRMRNR